MKHSIFYLALFLGLIGWSMPQADAKDDDKKLSKAEKRELKKKEKEARKKGKADNEDDEDGGKKKKKADKKAVPNAWKGLKAAYGKIKPNGKFFMYAEYTTLTEAGEQMLNDLIETERQFKAAKLNVLLINCEPIEEESAVKTLKKMKCKLPMVMKSSKLEEEELPGYTPGQAPSITIVDSTGKVKASGGPELLENWHKAVGAKAPAPRKNQDADSDETEDSATEEE